VRREEKGKKGRRETTSIQIRNWLPPLMLQRGEPGKVEKKEKGGGKLARKLSSLSFIFL